MAAAIVADLDPAICRMAHRRATRFLPAEDLAQEGRIEAWQALCRHYRKGDAQAYAVTAASHAIRLALQRRGSLVRGVNYHNGLPARHATLIPIDGRSLVSDLSDEGAGDPLHGAVDESSLDDLLRWCARLLPRRYYQCVWLHAALGYGHPEVARMLGLTPCTAETYYRRGLTTLRKSRDTCPTAQP